MPEKERAHTSHDRARSGAEMARGRSARACKMPERAHTSHDRAHISTERAHSRAHNSTEGTTTSYVRAHTLTYY